MSTSSASSGGSSGSTGTIACDGGNEGGWVYDGGILSCAPPECFGGNSLGIGAYCDMNNISCPGNNLCAAQYMPGYNFCATTCTDPTMSSFAQCGQGACCVSVSVEGTTQPVCVPEQCGFQMGHSGCMTP